MKLQETWSIVHAASCPQESNAEKELGFKSTSCPSMTCDLQQNTVPSQVFLFYLYHIIQIIRHVIIVEDYILVYLMKEKWEKGFEKDFWKCVIHVTQVPSLWIMDYLT